MGSRMFDAEAILLCIAGPAIGSFIGVLDDRAAAGESFAKGRSKCRACGETLQPLDLVPIFSFIGLGGRCRTCRVVIPRQLFTIEVAALAVTVGALLLLAPSQRVIGILLAWVLLGLAWFDVRRWRLPDAATIPLIVVGLVVTALTQNQHLIDHLIGASVGYVLFAGVAYGYLMLRGEDGLGGGDAKLLAAAGAWVGWQGLPWVVLISSMAALAYVLVEAFARRRREGGTGNRLNARAAVPFGPFLALGLWVTWVWTYESFGLGL